MKPGEGTWALGGHMYLSVCGSELLRDGRVTACTEGPCQADVPSCRSSSAALVCVCVCGGVLSAGGFLPAPFVHLGATHKGFTDLYVAVSTGSPAMTKKVTFSPPGILRPTDCGHRTGQPNCGCQDNGSLPLSPTETVYVAPESLPLLAPPLKL